GTQRLYIHFRVDRGGPLVPVPQQLPDIGERRPVAEQVAGDRVAQPVRPELRQPGPPAGTVHHGQDMRPRQPGIRGTQDDQQRPAGAGWPAVLHVIRQRQGGITAGSGSVSVRLPLPRTAISPACPSTSPRSIAATPPARSPSRDSSL